MKNHGFARFIQWHLGNLGADLIHTHTQAPCRPRAVVPLRTCALRFEPWLPMAWETRRRVAVALEIAEASQSSGGRIGRS